MTKGDKPLFKKSFYLDVKNHGLSNKLENKIKNFGGVSCVNLYSKLISKKLITINYLNIEQQKKNIKNK